MPGVMDPCTEKITVKTILCPHQDSYECTDLFFTILYSSLIIFLQRVQKPVIGVQSPSKDIGVYRAVYL